MFQGCLSGTRSYQKGSRGSKSTSGISSSVQEVPGAFLGCVKRVQRRFMELQWVSKVRNGCFRGFRWSQRRPRTFQGVQGMFQGVYWGFKGVP